MKRLGLMILASDPRAGAEWRTSPRDGSPDEIPPGIKQVPACEWQRKHETTSQWACIIALAAATSIGLGVEC